MISFEQNNDLADTMTPRMFDDDYYDVLDSAITIPMQSIQKSSILSTD